MYPRRSEVQYIEPTFIRIREDKKPHKRRSDYKVHKSKEEREKGKGESK